MRRAPLRSMRGERERRAASRFRSQEQKALVCRALLGAVDLEHCWTSAGPGTDAMAVSCTAATPAARHLFAACWSIWEGCTTLGFDEVLDMDSGHLELVGELLAALARGPAAIDEWLDERGT